MVAAGIGDPGVMQANVKEVWVGICVAIVMAALFIVAMRVGNIAKVEVSDGYRVTARFQNVGGLKVRAPVKIAGVLVGRVSGIHFDDQTYEAVVTMSIRPQFDRMPSDTSASIFTTGLLGEQYVGLEAGGAEDYIGPGGEFPLTQSALVLEQLIGQFLYNKAAE